MHFVIKLEKKNRKDFWCVFDKIADAVKFIHDLQAQIKEGDFACLNLKT